MRPGGCVGRYMTARSSVPSRSRCVRMAESPLEAETAISGMFSRSQDTQRSSNPSQKAMGAPFFARALFDQWGVGHPQAHGQSWDTGILVVVSKDDRKARIELGGGWARLPHLDPDVVASVLARVRRVSDRAELDALAATVRSEPFRASLGRIACGYDGGQIFDADGR